MDMGKLTKLSDDCDKGEIFWWADIEPASDPPGAEGNHFPNKGFENPRTSESSIRF